MIFAKFAFLGSNSLYPFAVYSAFKFRRYFVPTTSAIIGLLPFPLTQRALAFPLSLSLSLIFFNRQPSALPVFCKRSFPRARVLPLFCRLQREARYMYSASVKLFHPPPLWSWIGNASNSRGLEEKPSLSLPLFPSLSTRARSYVYTRH